MGFGGILAAMAQGLGSGMIKVADEAWKKDSKDREYQFYRDEAEKDRKFKASESEKDRAWKEKEMKTKHRNELSLAAFQSSLKIQEERAKNEETPAMKDSLYMDQYFKGGEIMMEELSTTSKKLEELPKNDPNRPILMHKIAKIEENLKEWSKNHRARQIVDSGTLGEGVKAKYHQATGLYNGYYDPTVQKVAPNTPPVVPQPSPSTSGNNYLVDVRDTEALKQAQNMLTKENQLKARDEQIKKLRKEGYTGRYGYWGYALE